MKFAYNIFGTPIAYIKLGMKIAGIKLGTIFALAISVPENWHGNCMTDKNGERAREAYRKKAKSNIPLLK